MNREFAKRRKTAHAHGRRGRYRNTAKRARVQLRSRDVEYRYRQDSDFYYLTGFAEPEAVAVLAPGRDNGEYILFCRDRDTDKETLGWLEPGPGRCS